MTIKKKFLATLMVEECGIEKGSASWNEDPTLKFVVYPNNHFLAEGEIYFSCKKSNLESTLKAIFKTEDPFMEKTAGLVPNMHTTLARMAPSTGYGNVGATTYASKEGGMYVPFLTRDAIYKEPEGSTKDLVLEIGSAIMGREPGAGIDLFGDLIEDLLSPKHNSMRK